MDLLLLTVILAQLGALIVGTLLAGHILGTIIGRALSHGSSVAASHVKRLTEISVWLAGLAFAGQYFGLRIDVLLILLSLLGAAFLIANKDALQNLAARYFSDVYMQFRIGDSIRVQGFAGRVIEMNPVTTILLTEKDEAVSIPNSLLTREIVVNTTPYAGRVVNLAITVDNSIDLALFEKRLLMSVNKLRVHLDERLPPMIAVKQKNDKITELQLMLRLRVPEMKDMVVRELNSRVKNVMEEASLKGKKNGPRTQVKVEAPISRALRLLRIDRETIHE